MAFSHEVHTVPPSYVGLNATEEVHVFSVRKSNNEMDQATVEHNVGHLLDKVDKGLSKKSLQSGNELESSKNSMLCTASFEHLSLEILVKIMSSLPLRDILLLETTSKKLSNAATIHLRTRKAVDFTEGKWYGEMSPLVTDGIFSRLLKRCPEVKTVLGIHPRSIAKRQQRHTDTLSVDGITAALTFCAKLKSIGTSNIQILDAMLAINPNLEIVGGFRNRGGDFPILPKNRLSIPRGVRLSQLILTGVTVPSLPTIGTLSFLQLRWVKFTDPDPFKDFSCPMLEHFIMKNCMGDIDMGSFSPITCFPLFSALGRAAHLERLELVRVPFPGGIFRHVVEDNWRLGSFRYLTRVSLASCYDALEVDLGYLVLVSAFRLEELIIQPSLTKDAVFSALLMAHAEYPRFECLHLGYVDEFPEKGRYTEEELLEHGLSIEREQSPALSDRGMKLALQVFPRVRYLAVCNCPNLRNASLWCTPNLTCMALRDLTLSKCKNLSVEHVSQFICQLPTIEYLHIEHMFKKLDEAEEENVDKERKLVVSSQMVKSVSLHKCGIIKLSVVNCPSLCTFSCSSCKNLSQVDFLNCLLNRVSFSWCPALSMKSVVDKVCDLPANASRIVSLRPTESFDPVELERQLFSSTLDYHLCIVHDHRNSVGIVTKLSIYSWVDTVTAINSELIDNVGFQQADCTSERSDHFPWGRDIYRIHRDLSSGPVEIIMDVPWFQKLSTSKESSCLPQYFGSSKTEQLPRLKNNLPMSLCLNVLKEEISESFSAEKRLHRHILVLYLNTVDVRHVYEQGV